MARLALAKRPTAVPNRELEERYTKKWELKPCRVTRAPDELLRELDERLGPIKKKKGSTGKMSIEKAKERAIVEKIKSGLSMSDIAKCVGTTRKTVSEVARKHDLAKKLMDNVKTPRAKQVDLPPISIPDETAVEEPIAEKETVAEEPIAEKETVAEGKEKETMENIEIKENSIDTEIFKTVVTLSQTYALDFQKASAVKAILEGEGDKARDYLSLEV